MIGYKKIEHLICAHSGACCSKRQRSETAMLVLITYDVSTESEGGKRRLRRVARACQDWGQRVQFSVFECEVDPAQWTSLRGRLLKEIDPEADSLRFYFLGANWRRRIEHVGAKPARDPDAPLVL